MTQTAQFSIAHLILASAQRSTMYALALSKGIDPTRAALKPRAHDNSIVNTNTPSFVFGHLALYPARAFLALGKNPGDAAAPSAWELLFKDGTPCLDDGTRDYPHFDVLVAHFERATKAALDLIAATPDHELLAPHPDPKVRERWGTIAAPLNFYYSAHVMNHAGQLSAWRRCMGLGSAL